MPLPDNTAPMMTGTGPFGAIGMGGMFSVVKVRRDQKAGDYRDPGWFKHPPGTVAYEWTGQLAPPPRAPAAAPAKAAARSDVEVTVRKPMQHKH
jgi:manganese oxidase